MFTVYTEIGVGSSRVGDGAARLKVLDLTTTTMMDVQRLVLKLEGSGTR